MVQPNSSWSSVLNDIADHPFSPADLPGPAFGGVSSTYFRSDPDKPADAVTPDVQERYATPRR